MSNYNWGLLHTLMVVVLVVTVTGRAAESNDSREEQIKENDVSFKAEESVQQNAGPSAHKFARHGLCNHRFGKVIFFKALRQLFHNISETMGANVGTVSYGDENDLELSRNDDTLRIVEHRMDKPTSPTVYHFARHGLCSHTNGKVRFYKALGKHFQDISATMTIYFVLDLCERKDEMLDSWVKEIFDKDGDGFISNFEKNLSP